MTGDGETPQEESRPDGSASGGQVRVADLGSRNGTRVNDEQVTGSRTLASGDVISLSAVNLVLHLGNHGAPSPLFVDTATLRQRIDGELVRGWPNVRHRPLHRLCSMRSEDASMTVVRGEWDPAPSR